MKLHSHFRLSLNVFFAISISIPVVLVTLLITLYINTENIKSAKQQAKNITEQLAMNINTYNRDLFLVTSTPSLYNDIFIVLSSFNRGYYFVDVTEQNRLNANYITTFTKMLHTNTNDIKKITFYPANPKNNLVYEIDKDFAGLQVITYSDYFNDINYKKALAAKGKVVSSDIFYDGTTPNEFLSYSVIRAIKDFDTKRIIGVLSLGVNFENIKNLIHHIKTSKNSKIVLANNDKILYSSSEYSKDFEKKLFESSDSFTINNHNYTSISVNIYDSDWKVFYVLSKNDLVSNNNLVYLLSVIVASVTIITSFLIFWSSSNRLVKSVNSIVSALGKIRGGDLSIKIDSKKMNTELKNIAIAVNEMTFNLDKHIKQEFIAVVEQKNAENRALQSQINPHFLYNTLNCLLALNRMGEKNKLESAVINLTKLLRYTSVSERSVALKTELDFLDKYIKLQQIHFEDRLTFIINCEKCCEDIQIPKLVLQPLVENSIVHGIEPTDKPMAINIFAKYCFEENLYSICIQDNGIGFDVNQNNENIGLSNVKKRLELWNDNLTFTVSSEKKVGTCILIKFKYTEGN